MKISERNYQDQVADTEKIREGLNVATYTGYAVVKQAVSPVITEGLTREAKRHWLPADKPFRGSGTSSRPVIFEPNTVFEGLMLTPIRWPRVRVLSKYLTNLTSQVGQDEHVGRFENWVANRVVVNRLASKKMHAELYPSPLPTRFAGVSYGVSCGEAELRMYSRRGPCEEFALEPGDLVIQLATDFTAAKEVPDIERGLVVVDPLVYVEFVKDVAKNHPVTLSSAVDRVLPLEDKF